MSDITYVEEMTRGIATSIEYDGATKTYIARKPVDSWSDGQNKQESLTTFCRSVYSDLMAVLIFYV